MSSHGIESLVDQQIRKWELLQQHRKQQTDHVPARPVVVVSGQHGAQRGDLGARIAACLGYGLWDRELLHEIAIKTDASEQLFRSLDEHRRNPITDALSGLVPGAGPGTSMYKFHLLRALHTIAQHGSAVVIGRGAQFVLGAEALRVRAVSPFDARVRALMTAAAVDERTARAEIERVDAEHAAFAREHYARDLSEASAYDLLVNTATLGVNGAAAVVVAAYRERFGLGS